MNVPAKKASFAALLYHEFLMTKKTLFIGLVTVLLCDLYALLCSLSMNIGNLSKYPEMAQAFDSTISPRTFAVICSAYMVMAFCENNEDTKPVWVLFRKSTPLSPWKYSFIKTLMMVIGVTMSYVLIFLLIFTDNMISGKGFTMFELSIGTFAMVIIMIMICVMNWAVMFFRNKDKAGITMLIVLMPTMFVIMSKLMNKVEGLPDSEKADVLRTMVEPALPYTICGIAAIIIINFFVVALLAGRRDK